MLLRVTVQSQSRLGSLRRTFSSSPTSLASLMPLVKQECKHCCASALEIILNRLTNTRRSQHSTKSSKLTARRTDAREKDDQNSDSNRTCDVYFRLQLSQRRCFEREAGHTSVTGAALPGLLEQFQYAEMGRFQKMLCGERN